MLVQSSCQSSLFIVYFERCTGHMWGSARVNLFILNEKSLNFKMIPDVYDLVPTYHILAGFI